MKNTIDIFIIAMVIAVLQSCGTKTNETTSEKAADSQVEYKESSNPPEMHLLYQKQMTELKEKRRVAHEALVATTPFYTHSNGYVVYNKVEVAPKYSGGKEAMESYLSENLVYPVAAKKDGLEGTVYVDFMVANDGGISNVVASNASWANVDALFNEEAVRVVSEMPKWIPGLQEGEAVYVAYSVPITFRLL